MKTFVMVVLTALFSMNLIADTSFEELGVSGEMSHSDKLSLAELDNLTPERSGLSNLLSGNTDRSRNRLSEKSSDRNLAKLVVVINRAPRGAAWDAQMAKVYMDGVFTYAFDVSTGKAGHESRIGYFRPVYTNNANPRTNHLRVYDNYYSSKYNSLMAKAIFYSGGYAIHHTDAVKRLGTRASHGCVRFRIEDITIINDAAMRLGNSNYTKRGWTHNKHVKAPYNKRNMKNTYFRNLGRTDVPPINRWTGKLNYSKNTRVVQTLDMVILVKDQRG